MATARQSRAAVGVDARGEDTFILDFVSLSQQLGLLCYELRGLNNGSRGWKSEIKVPVHWVPGLEIVTFSLCPPAAESSAVSSCKDTSVLIRHPGGPTWLFMAE